MGDWEDFCSRNGKPNDGNDEWLIDSINNANDFEQKNENTDKTTTNNKKMYFKDLEEAKEYAMKNPGTTFVKNQNGPGFVLKGTNEAYKNLNIQKENIKRQENIKHGKPARSGLSWRDHEIGKLLKLHSSGQSIQEISNILERSVLAISAKLCNLDLISEEEHQKIMNAHNL